MYRGLAGNTPNYIRTGLTENKEGKGKNPIMGGQAAALRKDDIKTLAQYFGAQESPLYTPSVHGALKP